MPSSKHTPGIVFLGDFCLSGEEILVALDRRRLDPWQGVRQTFLEDCLIVANLECPFTNEAHGLPYKWANLKASPDLHWVLEGLSMVVLGNNHIADFGIQGVRDTHALLDRKGISHVGFGATLGEALQPSFLELGDQRVGIVSLCCPTTNGENLANHHAPGVAPLGMATLKEAVESAYSQCDALVVYLHWGCEWVHDPAPDQLRLARHAIDCGADAVVGSHSHTIQSFEQYRGRWIFYGLGNYLFKAGYAQALRDNGEVELIPLSLNPPNRESLAVSFRILPDSGAGRLALDRVQPMRFGDDWEPRPVAISDLTFDLEAANDRLRTYATHHETALRDRKEPVFRARLLNGSAMAYWYGEETILAQNVRLFDFFLGARGRSIQRILSTVKNLVFVRR